VLSRREALADCRARKFFLLFFSPSDPAIIESFSNEGIRQVDLFALTRALVDIESTTPCEGRVSEFLRNHLAPMANRFGGKLERMPVEPGRENIFVSFGAPIVTLSTHMDTVPPFFASSEDETHIRGRGSCDAKGIIAAMIDAARLLLESGTTNIGLLFLVGEERNSAGALAAAKISRGTRFIINGEPTENRLALGSKGSLRYQITARGRMAHSAYPELGESAIEKLLDVLHDLGRMPMPSDPLLGASTLNIGTIEGGRAPNVIPDYARAEILIRLVADPAPLKQAVTKICAGRVEAEEVLCIPAVRLGSLDGYQTTVAAFTTDIPAFAGAWGTPFLIGPGTIHVAHTSEERVAKKDLRDAVEIYMRMVKQLQTPSSGISS
jgi:acetylornithine deacetylase